uniref:Uncharacterized protein n=1 Tax=Arundo donax TaxID=35708 RepID=A0A0A9G334_ARUDO
MHSKEVWRSIGTHDQHTQVRGISDKMRRNQSSGPDGTL